MQTIAPIQIQLIHIAKAQLGLSREEYEAAIFSQTKGKATSSKELTFFEADGLINYFKTLGFKIQPNRTSRDFRRARLQKANDRRRAARHENNVVMMPSPGQTAMIEALRAKVPWRFADGYQRWLAKYLKIPRPVTAAQAGRVIEGLKGLLKHARPDGDMMPHRVPATQTGT
jgi:hypothetical protein